MRVKDTPQPDEAIPDGNPVYALWLDDVRLLMRKYCHSDERLLHDAMCNEQAKVARKSCGNSIKGLLRTIGTAPLNDESLFNIASNADKTKELRDNMVAITDAPIHLGWDAAWSKICSQQRLLHRMGNWLAEHGLIRPYRRKFARVALKDAGVMP